METNNKEQLEERTEKSKQLLSTIRYYLASPRVYTGLARLSSLFWSYPAESDNLGLIGAAYCYLALSGIVEMVGPLITTLDRYEQMPNKKYLELERFLRGPWPIEFEMLRVFGKETSRNIKNKFSGGKNENRN